MVDWLPHINASLNGVATLLLILGLITIKAKKESLHKLAMLSCFGVSGVFLACYLIYHAMVGSKLFPVAQYPIGAYIYYPILLSHVLLAVAVPFLAIAAIYWGWKDQREKHRKVVKWAFPIWLYVSITGVVVYALLYWVFPDQGDTDGEATQKVIYPKTTEREVI
jgi:putative membrane protein